VRMTMSASDDCLLESEVRREQLAPQSGFELTTRTLTTSRVALNKVKFVTYFLPESGVRTGNGSSLPAWACGFEAV
jgi:hypothetical protein